MRHSGFDPWTVYGTMVKRTTVISPPLFPSIPLMFPLAAYLLSFYSLQMSLKIPLVRIKFISLFLI